MSKKDYRNALKKYMEAERAAYDALALDDINELMNVLEEARLQGKRIYICGNGGSGATASHFVCDFNKGVSLEQEKKYDFVCLNDNVPTMMAIANDISYEDVFVIPLQGRIQKGDVVIGISGSGNSENVVRALDYANQHGGITVALTGYGGGRLKKLAKHNIHVAVDNMQIVEDIHMVLDHMMMWAMSEDIRTC